MCTVRKYTIYWYNLLKQIEKHAFGNLFWHVLQRVQVIWFLQTMLYIYCVYSAISITFFNLQKRSLASKEALHSPNYIDSWIGFLYYNLMPPIERAPFICHPEKCWAAVGVWDQGTFCQYPVLDKILNIYSKLLVNIKYIKVWQLHTI
jgi:hypothetical protein